MAHYEGMDLRSSSTLDKLVDLRMEVVSFISDDLHFLKGFRYMKHGNLPADHKLS
jgi:hypothetical protein